MKNKIWWVISFVIILVFCSFLITNQQYFTRPFSPSYFADLYSQSQYVLGPASKGGIGDDGLYAFAGYFYLFQGGDVSSVNFEHPPLGKYLIGMSIFLFKNENIINIVYFISLLWITYKIGLIILSDKLLSLLAVLFVSTDFLLRDHVLRSMLDLPFSLFFLLGIYFFLGGIKKSSLLYISSLFFAVSFSVKFFPALLLVIFYSLITLFIYARSKLTHYLFSLSIIPFVYILSHTAFFFYHPSFIAFLQHKKWMVSWFGGSPRVTGNIIRNIFTGFYIDPTGALIRNEYWIILLPIFTILAFISLFLLDKQGRRTEIQILYWFMVSFFLYVVLFTLGLQKFIMPIFPIIIIFGMLSIRRLYSIIHPWKKKILKSSNKGLLRESLH